MKKLTIFTICVLSIAGIFSNSRSLAIAPEIFASTSEQIRSNELADLERQAQQAWAAENFASSIELSQRLVAIYTASGDRLNLARTLRNLALLYHKVGEISAAAEAISASFDRIKHLENSPERSKILAQILEVKAQLELASSRAETALEIWQQSGEIYRQIGDSAGVMRTQIDRARSMQVLGLYDRAIATLTSVEIALKNQPNSVLKARGLQSLGEALRVVGEWERSQAVLQESLSAATQARSGEVSAAVLISLGNLARVKQQPEAAIDFYQRAVQASSLPNYQIQALLNQLSLLVEQKQQSQAVILADRIQPLVDRMSPSRTAVYARINLARNLFKIEGEANPSDREIVQLLTDAVRIANGLQDKRAESYALGNLGKIYEAKQQWNEARQLTEKALLLARSTNAPDIAYQWQWQLGRILNDRGERSASIAAYTQAVKTLESLRSDLATISSDVQFSFKESVEPVYRELVNLLLQPSSNGEVEQEALVQARQTIESLQVAELDNFFRDACSQVRPVEIDKIDPKAAVFYPIILGDRLEVIVRLPGKPLLHYTTFVSAAEVEETIRKMRVGLTRTLLRRVLSTFQEPSQQVYNWLIRPIEADLAASGVETLVFIGDGSLRNIPMASLYSGQHYLAEKYSIAVAPALKLVDAQPLARNQIKLLAGGLSEARPGFDALPGVELELRNIAAEVSGTKLLNQSFTEANLQTAIDSVSFSIVHLATHGEFSSQAENTFILAWDDRINAKQLKHLLQRNRNGARAIELLVLSACRTAIGDRRATLGLAGVAVRAGARSTLASLWYVSDDATAVLMAQFYEELVRSQTAGNSITKAEALRRAQQALMRDRRYSHPYFWSAFVLVGNWL